jgi:parallel beta-helix repeat protein
MGLGERKLLKKTVSGIMLTLLLTSMLMLAFNIQPVKASGTITIRADGRIDPPDAPISTVDNITYTFLSNIQYSGGYMAISVERSNIIIDGNGYTLQGNGTGDGIGSVGSSNVIIKNTNIKGFVNALGFDEFCNGAIFGNNITDSQFGITLIESSDNKIFGNNITNNKWGITVSSTPDITSFNIHIYRNNITNNEHGIRLAYSLNNVLASNCIANNSDNFGVVGIQLSHFVNDIDSSNTVNGKPIYYWNNRRDTAVPLDAGYVALVNCINMTVEGLTLKNNYQGPLLVNTNDSKISHNNITNNRYGIYLFSSSNNVICHNDFINNTLQACSAWQSFSNIWDDGYPSGGNYWSNYTGVDKFHGPNQDQDGGDGTGDAPYIIDTNNRDRYPFMNPWLLRHDVAIINVVPSKTIVGQGYSLNINVTAQNHGAFTETFNVIIYHDKLAVPTLEQREIFWSMGDVNRDGYIDHIDIDLIAAAFGSNPGDPNWNPDADLNQDSTVDVQDLFICSHHYGQNIWIYFELSPPPIGKQTITLTSENTTTLTFLWNTAGIAKDNYIISAYATPVPGETDMADNNCTDGSVMVTWLGDVTDENHIAPPGGVPDGKVNENDIWYFDGAFIDYYKIPRLEANCDFDNNFKIDEEDLWTFCAGFIAYWKVH